MVWWWQQVSNFKERDPLRKRILHILYPAEKNFYLLKIKGKKFTKRMKEEITAFLRAKK